MKYATRHRIYWKHSVYLQVRSLLVAENEEACKISKRVDSTGFFVFSERLKLQHISVNMTYFSAEIFHEIFHEFRAA